MELKKQIDSDLKGALLAREKEKVDTLRGLKAVILDREVAEGKREEGLADVEIEKLVAREIKKRRESIEIYSANGRGDLVEAEEGEVRILEKYLPKQLSEEEIREKIAEVLMSLPEGEVADFGRVMREVKGVVGNSADGAVVARLVKEALA
jgi:uncharacterized protein YqeY